MNERNYQRLTALLESTKGQVFRARIPAIEGVLAPAVVTEIENDGESEESEAVLVAC